MPFTPFHIGPGAAIKAVVGHRFSLTVFGFSQIAIDMEPLVRILRGDANVHGFTHTYLGALLIGLFSLLAGKSLCEWLLNRWNETVRYKYLRWLSVDSRITWVAAGTGAFVGAGSHVFLDSIMHSDMHPMSPFRTSNGLLHMMPAGWLYLLCVTLGMIGVATLAVVGLWNKWAIEIE